MMGQDGPRMEEKWRKSGARVSRGCSSMMTATFFGGRLDGTGVELRNLGLGSYELEWERQSGGSRLRVSQPHRGDISSLSGIFDLELSSLHGSADV
jgi:hypothetical protein